MSSFEAMSYLKRTILLLILISAELSLFAQIEYAIPFRDGNKWGWADVRTGKIMIEPVYDSVKYKHEYRTLESGNERLIYKDSKRGTVGYMKDSNNCIVKIPPIYDNFWEMEGAENLYITTLNRKRGVYQAGYGEIVENKYSRISIRGDFLFLYGFDNNSYNCGLFSLVSKKVIDTLVYRILSIGGDIWTESFESKNDVLLENTLLEDKNCKYYYLAKDMTLKEVVIGLDFRFPKPPPAPISRAPSEPRDFIAIYYCHPISQSKTSPHSEIIATSRIKYKKAFTKIKGKRYLKIGENHNGNHIIGNRKGKKFGIIKNSIIIAPEFDSISKFTPEKPLNVNIFIGYRKNSRTFIVDNEKVFESKYDFDFCTNEHYKNILNYRFSFLRIRNGDLFGFVNFYNMDNLNNSFEWKLIEPKYKDLKISWLCIWATSVLVFEAIDTNGETFFVNKDGIEFRK